MEKVAPDIAYRRLKNVSDWRLVEENQRAALAAIVHGISRLDAAGHWGDGTTSASDGQRFAMPHKVLQRTYRHALQRLRPRVLLLRRRQLRPVLQPSGRVHRPRRALRARRRALPTRATSTSKSTTPTPTATPRSTSPRFGMVGMRFCPRIRSLHRQRIYCADPARDHGVLEPVLQARPSGGELPPHRRAVGPHRPVLRGVPRRARHRVGRPAEAQPLPGLEPLLRRQPRARPGR